MKTNFTEERKNSVLLHLYDWPSDNKVFINKNELSVSRAYLLNGSQSYVLPVFQYDNGVCIKVDEFYSFRHNAVIALEPEE